MDGTYNLQSKIVIKDFIKGILFRLNSSKGSNLKELKDQTDSNGKFTVCNRLLGVHQSRFEVLELINKLNSSVKPKVLCEIGTANSGTNLLLGSAVKSAELIIGLDLFVKNKIALNYYLDDVQSVQLNGDSKSSDTVERVKKVLNGRKIDFLFIDGDHSYEGVKADFEAFLPLMSSNGMIAFHDIVLDFKTRFGKDTGMWVGEVPKYWDEIKGDYNSSEIVENPEQDGQGIGIIQLQIEGSQA